jgi:hypothetical protein
VRQKIPAPKIHSRGALIQGLRNAPLLRPRIAFALKKGAHFMLHPAHLCWLTNGALFSTGQKRLRDARTYFRMNRQILTLGEVFVGLPSGRKLLMCAQCLLCPKTRPAYALRKIPFYFVWSWRRDLNPRPSDYKSDALPAELRQRKPPVTGHKVNKLAQRQSACNMLNHRPVRGNVTCVVPLQ